MKKKQHYYWMSEDVTKNPTGMVLQNLPELNRKSPFMLMPVDTRVRGFSHLTASVKPLISYDKKEGRFPKDLERFEGCWLITQKLKDFFESMDRDAFDFLQCESVVGKDATPSEFWLCDVVRQIEAVVEDKSTCNIFFSNDRKMYFLMPNLTFYIDHNAVDGRVIFRPKFGESHVICNRQMREKCKEMKFQGITFKRMSSDASISKD